MPWIRRDYKRIQCYTHVRRVLTCKLAELARYPPSCGTDSVLRTCRVTQGMPGAEAHHSGNVVADAVCGNLADHRSDLCIDDRYCLFRLDTGRNLVLCVRKS